ncbi:MAG: M42 family metallopeptidase [Caldilineaceae bacterium]|nr:M42 family metallopeptidase [Caldilineaceae bacterium]
MESTAHDFLKALLVAPSPSGYEQPVQAVVRDYVNDFADTVKTDLHGNVIVGNNVDAPTRVLLAGHCDQIGLVVTHIDDKGFLYTKPIGGWDPQQLIGQRMTVWTQGGPVNAVIARKPIHLLDPDERKKVVKLEEMWLDLGAKDRDEAASLVRIGDPVTLELGYQELRNGLANAPGMDNVTGVWVVIEALRRAAQAGLNVALFAVSTVQEEIGLRGAQTSTFGVDPQIGIAVDVTHATDCPTIDKRQEGDIKLGAGPVIERGPNVNPRLFDRLVETAVAAQMPYQIAAHNRGTGTDANAIQLTRAGVATGLVSIPNRYMHSAVETISLEDIDRAADLLAAFVSGLGGNEDFTP